MRVLPIIGDLDVKTIANMCDVYYDMIHDQGETEELEVMVCSGGGDSDVYCAFVDMFRVWREKGLVHTIAVGEVMSGAPLIVAAGSKGHRRATPHSMLGLHEPYINTVQGDPAVFESERTNLQSTISRFYTLLHELTGTPTKVWRKRIHGKSLVMFDAKQAKRWNLVDKII